jgi:putative colanic acid biosynthesis acetyltransferase WcaF
LTVSKRLDVTELSLSNKLGRILWGFVWFFFFRLSPTPLHFWRNWLLKMFGAKLGRGARVYPSAKVWAPWNLELGENSTLAANVDCYSVGKIVIGKHTTISQSSVLCGASHDFGSVSIMDSPQMPLLVGDVTIGDYAWITSYVFIGPGVRIGDGAVVLATSSVYRDVDDWIVVAGNPAKKVRERTLI